MSVSEQYIQLVEQKSLKLDSEQLQATIALDKLAEQLSLQQQQTSIFTSLKKLFTKPVAIQGIYFYGRVGRGKTMLMDLFYQQVNIARKKRIHFHHFMESVHQKLHDFSGKDNPLVLIAKLWAAEVDLLCFDEFYVNDIGDAMLLAGLLDAMLSNGISLVATSNCRPEQLYLNGLQRERFLPTIAVIHKYCQIISINGPQDHRLLESDVDMQQYRDFYVGDEKSEQFLSQHFLALATGHIEYKKSITLHGRPISYEACAESVIWFDFMAICSSPRSQRDYIKLADQYATVLISNVPEFNGELIPAVFSGVEDGYQRSGIVMGQLRGLDDEARRFIALVDEFYDRGIRLIITAQVDISVLYKGSQLSFEFARCCSRLFEMQRLVYR